MFVVVRANRGAKRKYRIPLHDVVFYKAMLKSNVQQTFNNNRTHVGK